MKKAARMPGRLDEWTARDLKVKDAACIIGYPEDDGIDKRQSLNHERK